MNYYIYISELNSEINFSKEKNKNKIIDLNRV